MCWSDNEILDEWRTAKFTSLFKKEEPNNPENYRVISLLNTAYKVCSKMVNTRFQTISEDILLEEQAGF